MRRTHTMTMVVGMSLLLAGCWLPVDQGPTGAVLEVTGPGLIQPALPWTYTVENVGTGDDTAPVTLSAPRLQAQPGSTCLADPAPVLGVGETCTVIYTPGPTGSATITASSEGLGTVPGSLTVQVTGIP